MRGVLISLAAAFVLAAALSSNASVAASSGAPAMAAASPTVYALQQQPGSSVPSQIDINVNRGGGGRWYANPIWIGFGVLAVIVILLLVVMAARGGGGGTTIVKD